MQHKGRLGLAPKLAILLLAMLAMPSIANAVTAPSGIKYYVPITLTNSQSSATNTLFQQLVSVNSSKYQVYESTTVNNIEFFYANGTLIQSWLESGNLAFFNSSKSSSEGSYIQTGTTSFPTGSSAGSAFAWVYADPSDAGNPAVFSYGTGSATAQLRQLDANIANGKLTVNFGGWNNDANGPNTLIGNGGWHFVGYSYSAGATQITLFLDGNAVTNSLNGGAALNTVIGESDIGRIGTGCICDYFEGSIADVQLYNSALSISQANTLYNEGLGGVPLSGNVLWMPLTGNGIDLSGNGNGATSTINVTYVFPASISTNTVYWLKVNPSIAANGNYVVYMGFASNTVNEFSSTNVGESPQASYTYGNYDDGANVFPMLYQNFAGSSTPSGWTSGGVSQNNGVSSQANLNAQWALTNANYGLNANQILDFYGLAQNPNFIDYSVFGGYSQNNILSGHLAQANVVAVALDGSNSQNVITYYTAAGSGYSYYQTNIGAGYRTWSVYWPSSSSITFSYNYSNSQSLTSNVPTSQLPVGMSVQSGSKSSIGTIYWTRLRTYPPSGVMPGTSFGSIINAQIPAPTISPPSNTIADQNQYESFNGFISLGTAPYNVFLYVANSVTKSTVPYTTNAYFSGTAWSFNGIQIPANWVTNSPLVANVIVTDTNSNTGNSVYTSTFTVNSVLASSSFSASNSFVTGV